MLATAGNFLVKPRVVIPYRIEILGILQIGHLFPAQIMPNYFWVIALAHLLALKLSAPSANNLWFGPNRSLMAL